MWHCVPEAGVCVCTNLGCTPRAVTLSVSPGLYNCCCPTLRFEKASASVCRLRSLAHRAGGGLSHAHHSHALVVTGKRYLYPGQSMYHDRADKICALQLCSQGCAPVRLLIKMQLK